MPFHPRVEKRGDRWCVVVGQRPLVCFPNRADADKRLRRHLEQEQGKRALTTKEKNDLSDDAFLVVLPGGRKDADGKTIPRDLRKLPFKGPDGKNSLALLTAAIQVLNGARGGVDISRGQKIAAWNRALKMIRAIRGAEWQPPARKF